MFILYTHPYYILKQINLEVLRHVFLKIKFMFLELSDISSYSQGDFDSAAIHYLWVSREKSIRFKYLY